MRILIVSVLFSFAGALQSMETPPHKVTGTKRQLHFTPPTTPEKGYGTEKDVGSPEALKKVKAGMGINRVNIKNFSGIPALLAFQGPQGQAHYMIFDFNMAENKQDAAFSNEMNLLKNELFISVVPELFRLKIAGEKLEVTKVVPIDQYYKRGFKFVADYPYRPGEIVTIELRPGRNLIEPIQLNLKYE
ncbi:MAG: hypothetical protein AMXMBFR12_09530 [Candidatus Babeliales bacterium]